MKHERVTCDGCEKDLTAGTVFGRVSRTAHEYRYALSSESLYNDPEWQSYVISHAPLRNPLHFCNVSCLKSWVVKYVDMKRKETP